MNSLTFFLPFYLTSWVIRFIFSLFGVLSCEQCIDVQLSLAHLCVHPLGTLGLTGSSLAVMFVLRLYKDPPIVISSDESQKKVEVVIVNHRCPLVVAMGSVLPLLRRNAVFMYCHTYHF